VAVRIAVEAEHALPRHVLAPPLAALLGFEHETRENITRALWTYIRMHSLQARSPHVLAPARPVLRSLVQLLTSGYGAVRATAALVACQGHTDLPADCTHCCTRGLMHDWKGLVRRLRNKPDAQPPQSLTDPGMVDCDARLGAVLGEPHVPLASMEQRLAHLLAPAPPHVLHYTVRCALFCRATPVLACITL